MAKKSKRHSEDGSGKTLLEKAEGHKVKRQTKTSVTKEQLEVYIAWFQGTIQTSQACFALDVAVATFRGNAGTTLRDAITQGKYELDEA